jgi:hypothetical protein
MLNLLALLCRWRRYSEVLKKSKTTHLVCKEAQGPKYSSALKWGTVPVTKQWLEACALSCTKVSHQGFHPPPPDQVHYFKKKCTMKKK